MGDITILGDGPLGRAVEAAALERGEAGRASSDARRTVGIDRPTSPRADLVVEASRGDAVAANLVAAPSTPDAAGSSSRRPAGRPTGRTSTPSCASTAPRPSRPRTSASAWCCSAGSSTPPSGCSARVEAFDPYLVEWHRRSKRDRPSGTALDLARRIADAHPRLADAADLEVGVRPGRCVAGDASRRLRCRRRDRRAPADRPRPDPPTRPASSPPPTGSGARRASLGLHPSTRSWTSSSPATPIAA